MGPAKGKTRSTDSVAQPALPGLEFKTQIAFGGSLLKNSHAKVARPLSSKQALHVVLRSDVAKGPYSLLKHERVIKNTLQKMGQKHGVKVYRVANAGNHLHLLLRFTKRRGLQNFLRGSTGLIARKVLGRERGLGRYAQNKSPKAIKGSELTSKSTAVFGSTGSTRDQHFKFWSQRPFTRIVSWGKDFDGTLSYLKLNSLEALGFISRKFTRVLPTQEIRNRVLSDLSQALAFIDPTLIRRAPSTS
jgi:REP element-mobilizing transposase RayT